MSAPAIMAELDAILDTLGSLDLTDPTTAERTLEAAHPPASLRELDALLHKGTEQGWLTPRRATPTLTFGRIAKPSESTHGLSIDAVDMSGAGAAHTHPNGEVSLCFPREGDPTFEQRTGWVVMAPGSRHVPTVANGRMVILYFLPDGAMTWG